MANNEIVTRLADPAPLQLVETIDSTERANTDIQVATAHRYPRNITLATNNSVALATMDKETAQSCGYALPRGGKPITGPSVHLAKIVAQQYGNLRAEAKVVNVTATQIISRGTAWDLENNYAVAFEVRRSIVDKKGQRFKEDMITMTGNAANAIAYRNAVFAVIPKLIIDRVYNAAQSLITGDLSDEDKLIKRRSAAIQYFKDQYNITEEEVIKLCGKQTVNQIRKEEIALLLGIQQSLKDGDTTVEEVMVPFRKGHEANASKLTDIAERAKEKAKRGRAKSAEKAAESPEVLKVDEQTGEVIAVPMTAENTENNPE